jgi:plastocyanin/mono/diheme cytochrome c family protein
MTDTPGPGPEGELPVEPEPEQRLPAVRPPVEPAPVERFTSTPSTRQFELTPERAAQVVRSSSNARWVGFLAVVVVILFVAIYWFYELGLPLGLSEPRLESEQAAQQVTAVERGYNLYEAHCARCHGANGEGAIGPTLNRQDKLFAHLNEDYLRNVLTVGGRYVCGHADSLMPIWSDQGHPPGPLNYRQIQELIAFLRATNDQTFIKRDPELLDPKIDPLTGEVETFTGWRDPNYTPAPGSTPYPACWETEFLAPASAAPSGGASAAPSAGASAPAASAPAASAPAASGGTGGTTVDITAQGVAFTTPSVTAPVGAPFTIHFDNQDAGTPHDVAIKDATGAFAFKGDTFPGVATRDYQVPALPAGTYTFVCTVHSNMSGTLTAG